MLKSEYILLQKIKINRNRLFGSNSNMLYLNTFLIFR